MKDLDPEVNFVLPAPPAPSMPPGLVGLMEDLSRSVLRNDPEDIFAFCTGHMRKLLVIRDGEEFEPKKAQKPLKAKIANAIAKTHKKAEKRRAIYDRLLAESAFELGKEQAGQVIEEEAENKLKGDSENSVSLQIETEQLSQTLLLKDELVSQEEKEKGDETRHDVTETQNITSTVDEQLPNVGDNTVIEAKVSQEKSEDETRHAIAETEKDTSTIDEQLPNKGDIAITETISAQEQPKNDLGVAVNDDGEEKLKLSDKDLVSIQQECAFMENNQETCEQNKDHDELEEVKRTVSDAIAEIESAAIKTVTDLTLNLSKNMEINSIGESDKSLIESASDLDNTNNEVTMIEKGSFEEQKLNETDAKINVARTVEDLQSIIQGPDANTSINEINETLVEPSEKLTMPLGYPQEEIEATLNETEANLNQAMLVQEEIHIKKHISDLKYIEEELFNKVPLPNENVDVNVTDVKDEEPSITVDVPIENNIPIDNRIHTADKEQINNVIIVDSELNPIIKQEDVNNDEIKEINNTDDILPIITADTNISNVENVNQKEMAVNEVQYSLHISDGVLADSESEKESQEKSSTSGLVTETPKKNFPISNEFINEIKITVSENQPHFTDNGEEGNTHYDLSNSERSPRSLTSNGSGDTDDAVNISAENSADSANTMMDLETAAVTIQKVFRSFLFKSRASTIDDETPLDIPYLPDAIQDSDGPENITKVEEEPRFPNKERRNLGLSRMDTVLQTVNEEKSLSLSDDSSTLSSAATVIQAHVRGYLVRNNLTKTRSGSSNKSNTQSSEFENEQQKKTVLNIHIVPEGSHFMSRDESLTHSLDLPLDTTSPPSLTSYHSLGYDITERRKLLKREDAIQSSLSPPSINSRKSIEVPMPLNDFDQPEIEDEHATFEDKSESEEVKECEISGDTTPTVSTTAETVIEVIKEIELNLECKESEVKLKSEEFENTHFSTSPEKDRPPEPKSAEYSGMLHSGEFHDVVLPPQPTQLSRDDPKHVAREFKANLVYFMIWN